MTTCQLCGEVIQPEQVRAPTAPLVAHIECGLRSVIGGIGHHRDHGHWCLEMGDPDAGLTYRQSALEVWDLIAERGLGEAAGTRWEDDEVADHCICPLRGCPVHFPTTERPPNTGSLVRNAPPTPGGDPPATTECGAVWRGYSCVRPLGHGGYHITGGDHPEAGWLSLPKGQR
jgi:hypothetical protein